MDERELNYVNAVEDDVAPPKKEKQRLNVPNFLIGLLVVALAAFGVYRLVQIGVDYFKDRNRDLETIEAGAYYAYLIPAAAIDIESFEDLSAASMSELVEMSVWGLLNSGLDSTQYQFSADELLLPEEQVAAAFVHYFGAERAIEHMTVSGYGYEFAYDAAAHVYKIPLTTITPVYAPLITSQESKGDAVVLTVGYLYTGLYAQNALTGELTAPEPDKYVKITIRTASTGSYISAVRSLGVPETAETLPQEGLEEDTGENAENTDGADTSGETDEAAGEEEGTDDAEESREEAAEDDAA